jgi:hypothetical protein
MVPWAAITVRGRSTVPGTVWGFVFLCWSLRVRSAEALSTGSTKNGVKHPLYSVQSTPCTYCAPYVRSRLKKKKKKKKNRHHWRRQQQQQRQVFLGNVEKQGPCCNLHLSASSARKRLLSMPYARDGRIQTSRPGSLEFPRRRPIFQAMALYLQHRHALRSRQPWMSWAMGAEG